MRSPTKQESADRRSSDHRPAGPQRRSETVRAARPARPGNHARQANPNAPQPGGVVTSMVDALEDILKWERASERALRVATDQSTTELDPSN